MSKDPDPVLEVVEVLPPASDPSRSSQSAKSRPALTRLYLTGLPVYVPKQRYDMLSFDAEQNSNVEPVDPTPKKIRTLYCLTMSIFWTVLFYSIALAFIPFIVLIVIAVYKNYWEMAESLNMSNSTDDTSDSPLNPLSN